MADLWRRHFLDSAQLRCFLPAAQAGDGLIILDVGTGAGFPGLVLALLGCGEVHLVEADRRKAEFLREAVRVTGANAQVHAARIEALTAFPVDVVTCRAFRSEEHTSELQSLMRISYAVFCLNKKNHKT